MKFYGDISEEHLIAVQELQALEEWFNEHGDTLPILSVSKGMTCIAFDYYSMFMDEEGERFLKQAEQYCPGYFKGPILSHMDKDEEFALLVRLLKDTDAIDLLVRLGFELCV